MANRGNVQRSASVYGSSSALRGVQLKIGEKFKPATKVTLPIGWKIRDPSKILNLTYDFRLEEQVIEKATAEKLAQEQEKNAQKIKEQMNLLPAGPVFANIGGDILKPTTVSSAGTKTQKDNKETINYKDFEGGGDTPFELVELQSINNMDALKSVLQPDLNNDIPTATADISARDGQDEQVANTNKFNGQSNTSDPQAMATLTDPFNTAEGNAASRLPNQVTYTLSSTSPSLSSNVSPPHSLNGYPSDPTQTEPMLNSGLDTGQDLNPFGPQTSGSSTSLVHSDLPNQSFFSSMNIPGSQQKNSGASSITSTILSADGVVSLPGAKRVLPPPPPSRPLPRRPGTVSESSEMGSSGSDGAVVPSDGHRKRPIPKPRSKLPPLKSNPNISDVPPPLPPKKSKEKRPEYENIHNPVLTVETDLNRYPSLPPISPPATPDCSSLSLHNLCSSMSSDEKQLVKELSTMGFPAQRVARAVQNFGYKQPEVLEFLIFFNKMCDLGYSEDQVEMVLKENSSDQEKAEKFLSLIAQFKELGFQEEKIFEALKKSECDSNKTLDILTCAS